MKTNQAIGSGRMSPRSSAAFWTAALLMAATLGGLVWVWADHSAWDAVPLAAVMVLIASIGITLRQSRASVGRRVQTRLDAFAAYELASDQRYRAALLQAHWAALQQARAEQRRAGQGCASGNNGRRWS